MTMPLSCQLMGYMPVNLQDPGHMDAMHRGHLFAAFMCVPYDKIMLYHTPTCTLGGRNRTRQCAPCTLEDVVRRLCSGTGHPMSGDFELVRAVLFKMYVYLNCRGVKGMSCSKAIRVSIPVVHYHCRP